MTKPIESFFDVPEEGYRLWNPPTGTFAINQQDIIFQAPLNQKSKVSGEMKEYYFVLTKDNFFLLKSEQQPQILSIMPTKWVRCDYVYQKGPNGKGVIYCIKFVRNMRFVDLWTNDEQHFLAWRDHLCKVFLQCDFHSKFNTIKMIGKGSFARVYLVEDKDTKARFAVKAFSKEYLLSQPKGKESLVNEIEVMRQLDHKYIMKLEEVHEKLLQGGELLNYISHKKGLNYKDYWKVMKCIMEALAYMNKQKIMHRDLKPDNMILKFKDKLENCTLKIVDFGLATVYDIPEYLFKRCGTPGFVAPEVINAPSKTNIHYTPQCDVFSAGVIFYILLTEKSPFDGKSFKEILHKNKKCQIDYKHPKLQKNKVALDLLRRMCEVDPEKRISAEQALKHKFFTDINECDMEIEQSEGESAERFQEYQQVQQIVAYGQHKNVETNSLIIRNPVINGRLDTCKDSVNSQGMILSFKSMSKPQQKNDGVKRESILKYVLLQNTKGNQENIYLDRFVQEAYDSDSEDEFEF